MHRRVDVLTPEQQCPDFSCIVLLHKARKAAVRRRAERTVARDDHLQPGRRVLPSLKASLPNKGWPVAVDVLLPEHQRTCMSADAGGKSDKGWGNKPVDIQGEKDPRATWQTMGDTEHRRSSAKMVQSHHTCHHIFCSWSKLMPHLHFRTPE